jgi:choline dehydrogenase-like flavoprotein
MLDAGIGLEPARAEFVAQMRRAAPADWEPQQLARLKEGTSADTKGIPLKLIYGSDFPYRESEQHLPADYDGVGLRPSLAQGGLSNVWGAAMLPHHERDLAGWPIQVPALAQHYAAVLKLTGLSARHDDLERSFPLYLEHPPALDLSRQSQALLARLERNRTRLEAAGIQFGQARLAVRAAQSPNAVEAGCVYCGLCMYGCPYGYIYNSADTLRQLQQAPNFSYEPGLIVTKLRESGAKVVIEGYERSSRKPIECEATRVYLAGGVLPTTQILLRSAPAYDQTVWMKDSQYFLLPLALTRSGGDVRHEALHTLSQLFVEIFDAAVSPNTVHLQVYSYNDLIGDAVAKALGPFARPLRFLGRALERRLLIVQGYLHSDHSARIAVTLKKSTGDGPERLHLQAQLSPETKTIIGRVVRKLLRHAPQLGAFPVGPMLQIAQPGRGFHSGGTFPMRSPPAAFESDTWGRPHGWQRVHAVDASVLPSIPATTITFSVMANAHRIAWETAGMP